MDNVLGKDWCLNWHKGLPHYVDVPGEVNIMEILRLWTYAKSLDLVEWGKMRYNLLGQGDHWFPGEHVSKLDLNRVKNCLGSSPFADQIPEVLAQAHALMHDGAIKRLSESD